MKDTFPTLKIGLQLSGKFIIDYYGNASRPECKYVFIMSSTFNP